MKLIKLDQNMLKWPLNQRRSYTIYVPSADNPLFTEHNATDNCRRVIGNPLQKHENV